MSTSTPPDRPTPADPDAGGAAVAPPDGGSAQDATSGWETEENTDSVAAAVDGMLENPMWSEKTAIAPATPPPAPHAPTQIMGGTEPGPDGQLASSAATVAPAGLPPRPLAATMAGPVALASGSAEAIPVTIGATTTVSGARPIEAPADAYLNAIVADRYRVLRKLGEGGMGTVYLAEHIIIEKKVALKVLSEDFARKADLVQRFMQEAKAASRIGHENIVDITDFGETPSGSVFIAMEFLEGADLSTVIRTSGALPFERARYIVTQICRALGAAHAKGIIHRDMKPENVFLVEREGRPDFVKILDFGIAKVSSLDEGGSRLTRTGMIFGTPEYMSPEQARGDRPDHRVDIYAVGCILYELLTGDVPFHADTFMGVLTKHMFEQPQPLSLVAPDRNIPPEVEQVVLRAIAKDREHRFQSMKEFSLALAACGGGDVEAWGNEPSGVGELPGPRPSRSLSPVPGAPVAATTTNPAIAARNTPLPSPPPPPEATQGRGMWIVGGLLGLLAIGGGAWMALRPASPGPAAPLTPTVPAPAAAVAPTPAGASPVAAPTPPTVAPPAAPVEATISINSTPTGAEVVRDRTVVGITPMSIKVPIGARPVSITLRKRDFRDRDVEVIPDENRSYAFDLMALRKGSSRPSARPTATPAEPGPSPPSTPATKPAGRLRDLKDPFSEEPAKKH